MSHPPDLAAFESPWEHVRLLSDRPRNEALAALLVRRARGARVVEVGCGVGLWSCLAARLGAAEVWAVEPTALAERARALVAANGLESVVQVVQARVEELPPRPVDLAFSELLNADPFAERVVETMAAVRPWVVPGGLLAPARLRVYAALTRASAMAAEGRGAREEARRVGALVGLDVSPVLDGLAAAGAYGYVTDAEPPVGPAVLVWDVALGEEAAADRAAVVRLVAGEAGPVGGVMVWFEAELDDGVRLGNAPGASTHWGRQVYAWPVERGLRAGEAVEVHLTVTNGCLGLGGAR